MGALKNCQTWRSQLLVLVLGTTGTASVCSGCNPICPSGSDNCPCTASGSCGDGLACISDECEALDGGAGVCNVDSATGGDGAGSTNGSVVANCTSETGGASNAGGTSGTGGTTSTQRSCGVVRRLFLVAAKAAAQPHETQMCQRTAKEMPLLNDPLIARNS